MAGDWIKMRTDLAEDPAVIDMAAALGDCDEDLIVGKLHKLWSWADKQSRDGHAVGVTQNWIDKKVGMAGFAAAMVTVGWLEIEGKSVTFPNFERHNGETAKTRALGSKRKQKQRANGPDDVPDSSRTQRDKSETREEKRREEVKDKPLTPSDEGSGKAVLKRTRKIALTFPQFLEACRFSGEKPLTAEDPITKFTDDAGIPREYLRLAWKEFGRKHLDSGKKQADWRATFRNAVRGNWLKLWYEKDGDWVLTSSGVALQREMAAQQTAQAQQQPEAA